MSGGQGRNRTADACLFRAALYRLSYLATPGDITGDIQRLSTSPKFFSIKSLEDLAIAQSMDENDS